MGQLMLFACGAGILLADQWCKRAVWVRKTVNNRRLSAIVRFRFVEHREGAFERTGARVALVLAWVLAAVSATILYRFGAWFHSAAALAGLGLAFGGAASNLLDILRRRYVVDFIDLGWWPVFNLADAAILTGLAAALCS